MNAVPGPAPEPLPPVAVGPACEACGSTAVVHWRRRLTDDELAAHVAMEESRRESAALFDSRHPVPEFGRLPHADECTVCVYACADHAISLEAAARIHRATCTAPSAHDLPGCDCAPEPAVPPTPEAIAAGTATALPLGWT